MIYGNSVGGVGLERTYVLVDDDGNEAVAVLSDTNTALDATASDIRQGKTAATTDGVTVGDKFIPGYITTEGKKKIQPGIAMKIPLYSDQCKFTKFQAVVCMFNTNMDNSVAAEKVSINGKMYAVGSTEILSEVLVDITNQAIDLSLVNDSEKPIIIRYMSIKEEY